MRPRSLTEGYAAQMTPVLAFAMEPLRHGLQCSVELMHGNTGLSLLIVQHPVSFLVRSAGGAGVSTSSLQPADQDPFRGFPILGIVWWLLDRLVSFALEGRGLS